MSSGRRISVILKGQAKEEFEELNKLVGRQREEGTVNSEEAQLLKSIKQKIELLKLNPAYGDKVPRKQIPKNIAVSNLFKVNLTGLAHALHP